MFLETLAKSFLGFHGMISMVTLVSFLLSFGYLVLRQDPEWHKGRIWGLVGSVSYVITFVLGLMIYPVFRIQVRMYDFDINRQWATGIFEIKEHISVLAFFAVIVISILSLYRNLEESELWIKRLYFFSISISFLIILIISVIGLILVFTNPIK